MSNNKKIAIYTRKSKATDKGESIEAQKADCLRKAHERYPDTDDSDILFFVDEGFSGGNTKRPQFQKMMTMCENKEIKVIISYKIDRISRSINDFADIMKLLEKYGVAFMTSNENIDTTNETNHFFMYLLSLFADFERKTIAQRIRDNMHHLARSGRWLGGTTPIGYESIEIKGGVSESGKSRKAFKLKIIPEQAEIVKLLFKKYLELQSLTALDEYCLKNNIRSRQGKRYSRNSLKPILKNPVYAIADGDTLAYWKSLEVEVFAEDDEFDGVHGTIAYNKTDQSSGGTHKVKDVKEWIISVGKHRGIISGKDWVAVQELLALNTAKGYRKPRSNTALLSGLVICGNCGGHMYSKTRPERKNKDGETPFSYACEIKLRSKRETCQMKNIPGNQLDKMVLEQLKRMIQSDSEFSKNIQQARKTLEIENEEERNALERLYEEKKKLQRGIDNLLDMIATVSDGEDDEIDKLAKKQIYQRVKESQSKLREIEESITMQEKVLEEKTVSMRSFDDMIDQTKSLVGSLDSFTFEQKRDIIRTFIRRIIWDGENPYLIVVGSEYDIPFDEIPVCDILEKLRMDSKRDTHALPLYQKALSGGAFRRTGGY